MHLEESDKNNAFCCSKDTIENNSQFEIETEEFKSENNNSRESFNNLNSTFDNKLNNNLNNNLSIKSSQKSINSIKNMELEEEDRRVDCVVLKSTKNLKSKIYSDLAVATELILAIIIGILEIFKYLLINCIPRSFRFKNVENQVVLITGAGSGIGRLMAKDFALKRKAIVVAWDVNTKGNEETAKYIKSAGGVCYSYTVDVSNRVEIYSTAQRVKEEVGKVDILINNAGIVTGKRLLETPDEKIIKTFEVNALSNFWTTKAFLPDMIDRKKGHIVTIASLAGLFGTNRLVDYCASKFAAVGFDEALKNELKIELGHKYIDMTLVCPYYINTGMFDGVRSKIIPLLTPEVVVKDIVAGILTNAEQIVIPRYVYILIVLKQIVPGEVGRRIATAFGITGAMLTFKGPSPKTQISPSEEMTKGRTAVKTNAKNG